MVRLVAFLAILTTSLPGARAADGPMGPADIARIQQTIENSGLHWTAGQTRFTRMSPEERARYVVPPGRMPPWVERWGRPSATPPPPVPRGPLPTRVDWRDRFGYDFDTPIRDQGDCGSCWAFATIANLEVLISWRDSVADPQLDLSEQHLFDCALASLGCDSGGVTWYTTGSFLSGTGVTSEACYPYTSGDTGTKGTCTQVDTMSPECQQAIVQVDDLTEIASTAPGWPWWDPPDFDMSPEAMDEVKAYLNERPVGVSYKVYDDFYAYQNGIYEHTTGGYSGMHAVLIVGYDDDEQAWIVKNSWGDDFGEDGYFRIRYGSSSFGMFGFVYNWAEDRSEAAFCDDLPTEIVLDQSNPNPWQELTIANCGGGILIWQAALEQPWLELLDSQSQPVAQGAEVAVGRSYRVRLEEVVADGESATLTLTGAGNGPRTIQVRVEGEPPEPDDGPPDAGVQDGGQDADGSAGSDPGVEPDAGSEPDEDTPPDAGSGSDDDTPPPPPGGSDSGCGCTQSTPSTSLAGLLALLILLCGWRSFRRPRAGSNR